MIGLPQEYVSGFVDGEGCFSVLFSKNAKFKLKIEVRPSFSVDQGKSSRDLIKNIASFFGTPNEKMRPYENMLKYETRSLSHILNKVIPHFETYPLYSNKQKDFKCFAIICQLMEKKKHLEKVYLIEIIKLAYSMNLDSSSNSRREQSLEYWLNILQ